MWEAHNNRFTKTILTGGRVNVWDFLALILVLSLIVLLGKGAAGMHTPYLIGDELAIHLDPSYLPGYALRSVMRMLIALGFSLLLTFIFGTWAAKSKRAEGIILATVDVLQSAPVLSFLAIAAPLFIGFFPGSLVGPECAAIFAIITSQAWNMILCFYHSVRTVPAHFRDVSSMFNLSSWQQFWRIEVPYATPSLVWNMMISMSTSWFFVVASEALTVANQSITLPGMGSYIALAIEHRDLHALSYAIGVMFVVILLYNELLFKPLHQWSHKFQDQGEQDDRGGRSLITTLFLRSKLLQIMGRYFARGWGVFVNWPWSSARRSVVGKTGMLFILRGAGMPWLAAFVLTRNGVQTRLGRVVCRFKLAQVAYYLLLFGLAAVSFWSVSHFVMEVLSWHEMLQVCWLGLYTGFKVMVLIVLCSLLWVPVGVFIGMRPRLSRFCQPVVQLLAAFPANLFYPLVVIAIVKWHLNVDIWTAPLMVLGTQWYILFNVIAGAEALPKQLRHAANSFNVVGWLWWRRVAFPAIFPYFVTGAVTAAGGAWNASILAEIVIWGNDRVQATGLGAYITLFYESGDFHRVIWGTAVMCFYVLIINHLLWRPLYHYAQERFQID
jgi:NitT/TauT family transport system permease protein